MQRDAGAFRMSGPPFFSVFKNGKAFRLTLSEFEALTGFLFLPHLNFESPSVFQDILKETKKKHEKGELNEEQLWLGCYYRKEIESAVFPKVLLRWIDDSIGWGVFAAKSFKPREYIAEYSGKVRARVRRDKKNAYCFEYAIAPHIPTRYTIDAQDQGGISRFINHSRTPNLVSSLATIDGISHVILIASRSIQEGEQLSYDYGPDYWSRRAKPKDLEASEK